jgi:signal peptidase II
MFFADFYEGPVPSWIPLWGGSYYSTPIFNFADAAIFCGVMAILFLQNTFLTKD